MANSRYLTDDERLTRLEALLYQLVVGIMDGMDFPYSERMALREYIEPLKHQPDEDDEFDEFDEDEDEDEERSALERLRRTTKLLALTVGDHERIQRRRRRDLQYIVGEWISRESLGIDTAAVPLPRLLPVRIHLTRPPESEHAFLDALRQFADIMGFVLSIEYSPELGSWLKRLFLRTREFLTQEEVRERAALGEKALEVALLGKAQAEMDLNRAQGAAAILAALQPDENAAVQIGTILLVRYTDEEGKSQTRVQTLTQRELLHLEKHQELLDRPRELLLALKAAE